MAKNLRYSLVEMTNDSSPGTGPSPPDRDEPLPPPDRAVRIFNHSWYTADTELDYEQTAQLMDGTARNLAFGQFNFTAGDPTTGPAGAGALHVIAAGNYAWLAPPPPPPAPQPSRQVLAPGTAKNGLTVGASQTFNPRPCDAEPCPSMSASLAMNPRLVPPFSRIGYPNSRLKPDLVAPGVRSYGRRPAVTHPNACVFGSLCVVDLGASDGCGWSEGGANEYVWESGTSFAAPVVSGAAALVREWTSHRTTPASTPSSALLRAILIASARNLVPFREAWGSCCESPGNCWSCGGPWLDMRPTPDQQQGWGGVSLDKLFRPLTNYYFFDQNTTFTANGQSWTKSLIVADSTQPIDIALVWTERPSLTTVSSAPNLLNDLDVKVTATGTGGVTRVWYGNYYYRDRNDLGSARTGYSLPCCAPDQTLVYDRYNNVERINIEPASMPAGATSLTVTVTAFGLTANGLDPLGKAALIKQDFALFAVNARE